MEDVLKFLLIAAVVVVALVRQFRKETQEKASPPPAMPFPEQEPNPQDTSNTYGGYIPEGPAPEPAPHPVAQQPEGQRTTRERRPQKPDKTTPQREETPEDFRIHSAEEARRAIIWGEILNRKY